MKVIPLLWYHFLLYATFISELSLLHLESWFFYHFVLIRNSILHTICFLLFTHVQDWPSTSFCRSELYVFSISFSLLLKYSDTPKQLFFMISTRTLLFPLFLILLMLLTSLASFLLTNLWSPWHMILFLYQIVSFVCRCLVFMCVWQFEGDGLRWFPSVASDRRNS